MVVGHPAAWSTLRTPKMKPSHPTTKSRPLSVVPRSRFGGLLEAPPTTLLKHEDTASLFQELIGSSFLAMLGLGVNYRDALPFDMVDYEPHKEHPTGAEFCLGFQDALHSAWLLHRNHWGAATRILERGNRARGRSRGSRMGAVFLLLFFARSVAFSSFDPLTT